MRHLHPPVLSEEDREFLEGIVKSRPWRSPLASRARVLLAASGAADLHDVVRIGREAGVSIHVVEAVLEHPQAVLRWLRKRVARSPATPRQGQGASEHAPSHGKGRTPETDLPPAEEALPALHRPFLLRSARSALHRLLQRLPPKAHAAGRARVLLSAFAGAGPLRIAKLAAEAGVSASVAEKVLCDPDTALKALLERVQADPPPATGDRSRAPKLRRGRRAGERADYVRHLQLTGEERAALTRLASDPAVSKITRHRAQAVLEAGALDDDPRRDKRIVAILHLSPEFVRRSVRLFRERGIAGLLPAP